MFKITRRANLVLALLSILVLGLTCVAQAGEYKRVDNLGHPKDDSYRKQLEGKAPLRKASQGKSGVGRAKGARTLSSSRIYMDKAGHILLFGTSDARRRLENVPDWLSVIERNEETPIFQEQKYFTKTVNWAEWKKKLEGMGFREQLREVNQFWNQKPYKEDKENWRQEDYWEIPAEFLKYSGDCEDYAIVKYYTLKELGVDPKKMRIVVLKDTIRNLGHAVLAVYTDDDVLILDNLSSKVVLSHKQLPNYEPVYSVNEFNRWSHLKK